MHATLEAVRSALAGRYDVEREIGVGGMASVFLATDLRHDRRVAIKVLLAKVTPSRGTDRFRQEIRLAAGLTHPHVLPVLDSGEFDFEGTRTWYATPYVEGESLRDRLRNEGPLPVSEAIRIVAQIADALDYAHRQGVIHRDVKPENILLPDGQVFLADFGVARPFLESDETRLTEAGMAIGTPRYMSPEQATGSADVDLRTDIYALGCVLYETLTGGPPFDARTPMAIVAKALTETPPRVSEYRPAAEGADEIVAKSLSRLPADRYQSAADFGNAVRSLNAAATPSRPARQGVLARIAAKPALVLGGLMLAVALGLAALWWPPPTGPGTGGSEARIAVLPFRAIGEAAAEMVDGITIATRDRLAVVDGIAVVGAASSAVERLRSMPASEVALELRTDYVLTATVEQNATTGSVEVRPSLVGANGTRVDLWTAGPIIAPVDNPGRAEVTIASDVARALDRTVGEASRANLTGPERSPVAYALYLRGLGAGAQSAARFEEALAVDSTFVLARAPLAEDAMVRYQVAGAPEDSATLLRHADAMIRHAPGYYGGHMYLGLFHRTVSLDHDSALAYLDQARSLAPGSAVVGLYRAAALWNTGRLEEALVEARRGAGLDPLSSGAVSRVSRILLWQHRLDEARSGHQEVLQLGVQNVAPFVLADGPLIFAASGMPDSARAYVAAIPDAGRRFGTATFLSDIAGQPWLLASEDLRDVCADRATSGYGTYVGHHRLGACAVAAWQRGDTARARALADSMLVELEPAAAGGSRDERVHMGLAYAHFFLGNRDEAVRSAERALATLPSYWDFYPGAMNAIQYTQLAGLMGDVDMAVDQLEPMLSGSSPLSREWLSVDPSFDPLREAPRFQELLSRR